MSLILTTLTSRGVVLATDRRTTGHNRTTDKDLILSDLATKILVGNRIAVAVFGSNEQSNQTGYDVVEHWLAAEYDDAKPFRSQVEALYDSGFKGKPHGGFVAVTYFDGASCVYRTAISGEPQYDERDRHGKAKMKFNGSGNTIAGKIVDLAEPPIAGYDIEETIEFSRFVITATHNVMRFGKRELPSVGPEVMVAVVDYRGARFV